MWLLSLFYNLSFIGYFHVIVSHFDQFQLMTFLLGIVVLTMLTDWKTSLVMLILGMASSVYLYKWYMGVDSIPGEFDSLELKIVYCLMLTISIFIFKPKQQHQKIVEQKIDYLGEKVDIQDVQINRLECIKEEFIRNIRHEAHTPLVGITSLGQVMLQSYDHLDEKQRRGLIEQIAENSDRLESLVENIIDLSRLKSMSMKLRMEYTNLGDLVRDRVEFYRDLFLKNSDQEIVMNIEQDVIVKCDRHYIGHTIDNLLRNAVQYSQGKPVTIDVRKSDDDVVEFVITDSGIGIPEEEIKEIFDAFIVSSKTKTPAGGRGVGLALCKAAIEAHGGSISAESKGEKGAQFRFFLIK